jgi:NAD+ synthetase
MPVLDPQALIDNRVEAIREYHSDAGITKAEIDVSGGVDSAILVMLLARALDPENVIAVHSGISTNPEQTARAQEVCDAAGVKLINIDLGEVYETLIAGMKDSIVAAYASPESIVLEMLNIRLANDPTILGSIRSTLRAPVGRGFNRMLHGGIRHGTGNECEDRWTRFYQKGGDGEVDTNPIAMLSKAEAYQLALALGVPKSIITATPSPDLWGTGDSHSDEAEFSSYFGFRAADYGQTFYGYIDVETGEYTKVGLIERVSRFLDMTTNIERGLDHSEEWSYERLLFGDFTEKRINFVFTEALVGPPFAGLDTELVAKLLVAARRIERTTRHKFNPNCPTLGDREDLIEYEILTDDLPEV